MYPPVPDLDAVAAFLDAGHAEHAEHVARVAAEDLSMAPEADDDAAARVRARALLAEMGQASLYESVRREDVRASCLTRETLAAASPLADAVWALQGLGVTPLLLAGDERQRSAWVPEVMAGRVMTAFVMTEPDAGSDVGSMSTRAVRDGADYVLSGRKTLISNAGIADLHVVFARTGEEADHRGLSCFLVPSDTAGLSFAGAQVMSAPHPLGELDLDACRVPASARLGAEGEGFKLAMATLDRLRPTVGAAACGMAGRALHEALGHALTRRQFGRELARFQIVKEKLGRMAIQLCAARLLVYRAAWAKDQGAERITSEAAAAKAFATEEAQRVIDEAVQIVGGRGVLRDHPVELLYRSIRALRIYEGTTEIQRLIVADRLIEGAG